MVPNFLRWAAGGGGGGGGGRQTERETGGRRTSDVSMERREGQAHCPASLIWLSFRRTVEYHFFLESLLFTIPFYVENI